MFKGIIFTDRSKLTAGEKTQQGVTVVSVLLIVGATVVSVVLARSVPEGADQSGAAVGLTALVLFMAAGAVGAGFGFLFGLPRSRLVEPAAGGSAAPLPSSGGSIATFLANSNLTKVSDWLTTIVIGLGLVNLANIGPAVRELQQNLTEPLGGSDNAGVLGVSIVLVALLAGALLTFLWTTIRVRELFEDSERQYVKDVPSLVGSTVQEAKDAIASSALRLVVPDGAPNDARIVSQSIPPGTTIASGAPMAVEVKPQGSDPASSVTSLPLRDAE